MDLDNKDVEHESIYVGADAVHPEDREADVILPGEPGYQPPEETDESAGEDGQGKEAVPPDAAAGEGGDETPPEEEEAQAEDAEPEQEDEPQVNQQKMIPKARLDKELRARRALEARIKELEQGAPRQAPEQPAAQQQTTEVAELDIAELEKAFLEGDMSGFGKSLQALLSSRDNQMRDVIRAELQKEVPGQLQQNQQRQSFEAVRDELETQYEFLDPNSDQFDDALVDTISTFTRAIRRARRCRKRRRKYCG